jgi:hypothetical protein
MSSIFDDESHSRLWIEALEIKYGSRNTGCGREEQMSAGYWDRILGSYSVTPPHSFCSGCNENK